MPPRSFARSFLRGFLGLALVSVASVSPLAVAQAETKSAKYYFRLGEVKAPPTTDSALREEAARALREELAARPEWASDLGVGDSREAQIAALGERKLRGFEVTVKLAQVKRDLAENRPGVAVKRVGVSIRLEVLGLTLPGEKLAFAGEGSSKGEIEASERRLESEARSLEKELLHAAVKQAVDNAMVKLALPASAPQNEKRRKPRK